MDRNPFHLNYLKHSLLRPLHRTPSASDSSRYAVTDKVWIVPIKAIAPGHRRTANSSQTGLKVSTPQSLHQVE